MKKPTRVWTALSLLLLSQLAACGLKGPLVLPKEQPAASAKSPAEQPAPKTDTPAASQP